jgi:nitrogen fixation protein FixH
MARRKPRQAGWWIPWVFVGGFVLVIGVNAGMVTAAFATFTGLTTKNYYRRGLAYNKVLEAADEQRRRGWKAALRFIQTGTRKGRLVASFADRQGVGLLSLDVAVRMVRPTNAGNDFSAVLKPLGDGRYAADVAFPLPGQWRAEVLARRGKAEHRLNQHLEVR